MRQLQRRAPDVAAHAKANGWVVLGLNGRGHFRLRHEDTGREATCGHTAHDYRAQRNVVAWMRRIEDGRDERQWIERQQR